ncbi:hypothetical protein Dsin_005699 [Dipteronia sinensis]|uniref:Uncharacterized protein n=1 Tax=Dipteronia sinensis TaxID=43782 RepID=A0AAE0AYB3_9ROSI|nr:hypothetical protein Dsin_005699 [Dipteronia sinensis]
MKHTSALTLKVPGNAKVAVAAAVSVLIFRNPGESSLVACRRLSSTILTPDSSDGTFPADLLSRKAVQTT